MHRHHLRCRGYGYLRRTGMFGEFSRDDFSRTDQDDFNAELLTGKQDPFDHNSWGSVSAHRVDGDFRHSWRN